MGRHASRTIAGVTETYELAGETETVTAIGGLDPDRHHPLARA